MAPAPKPEYLPVADVSDMMMQQLSELITHRNECHLRPCPRCVSFAKVRKELMLVMREIFGVDCDGTPW